MEKQYYIDAYETFLEEDRQVYIKDCGTDKGWDSSVIESDLSVEGVVGYYLVRYGDKAYETWFANYQQSQNPNVSMGKEITNILQSLH